MIHLKPSDEIKVIRIINRKYSLGSGDLYVNIRDEQTNETILYTELQYQYEPSTQYLRVYGEIDLVEGHTYEFELLSFSTGNVWHRNKIFATNQTIDQSQNEDYSINDGEYVQHTNESKFIIL
jgi:hypothetical protein